MLAEQAVEAEELEVKYVPDHMIGHVWDAHIEQIESAMSKGQGDWGTSDEMLAGIVREEAQLWVVASGTESVAVVVTELGVGDSMTKLFVKLIAGKDMPEWADLVNDFLKRLMDHVGADLIEASCRPGLAKFLMKEMGWSQKAIVVELR